MADLRCYLTKAGIAAENNAKQFGTTLKITEMVFDGSYLADEENPENLSEVINPVLTVPCSTTISDDEQTLTFKGSILVEQGGFNVWGVGLKTDSGVLYGYARSKGDKILTEDEGATESVRYAVDIITKNSDVIEIKVNPSTVYADLEDVDNAVKAGIADHEAKSDPHSQYIQWEHLVGLRLKDSFAGVNRTAIALRGDGTEVLRDDFPKLLQFAIDNDQLVDQALIDADPEKYAANYGTGDGATTFTLPNYGLMPWEAAAGVYGAAGTTVGDAMRNITGQLGNMVGIFQGSTLEFQVANGVFERTSYTRNIANKIGASEGDYTTGNNVSHLVNFDSSNVVPTADVNRPKSNFSEIWIIHGEIV